MTRHPRGLLAAAVALLAVLAVVRAPAGPAADDHGMHAGAATPVAAGVVREITMPGKAYVPQETDVLVGDTVVWVNQDTATHTVTAEDDAFDSGSIAPGGTFTRTFDRPATVAYACTIHKFMRGTLRVVPVALTFSTGPVAAGGVASLAGLAPEGTGTILVQRTTTAGWSLHRRLRAGPGGRFAFRAIVDRPTRFRALVGRAASAVVPVPVAPRVTARVGRGRAVLGQARPARAGAVAVLQVYDRERFDWLTVVRGRVDASSRFALALPAVARGRYRVLVRGGGGWAAGASAPIVLR